MGAGILAFASIAASLVSTGVAVYGQNQQAKSAVAAAKYNNQLAEGEATNLQNTAREAQTRERQRNRRQIAQLRNNLAGQGTLNSSGTPLAILSDSQANLSLGIADAARATDMQAASLRARGQMGLWEANQYKSASRIGMFGSALSGATKAVSGYRDFKYTGAL
jgi:hypothetical protein